MLKTSAGTGVTATVAAATVSEHRDSSDTYMANSSAMAATAGAASEKEALAAVSAHLAETAASDETTRRTTIALDQYQRLQLYNYALSIEQRLRLPPQPQPSAHTPPTLYDGGAPPTTAMAFQHAAALAAASAFARSSLAAVGGTATAAVSETRAYSYALPMRDNGSRPHVHALGAFAGGGGLSGSIGGKHHGTAGPPQQHQAAAHTQRLALSMSLFPSHIFQPEEPKPQHSYIGLIAMAILSSADRKLVLSDIYQHILDNYAYFRSRGPGWRNSIRHNLSLNDCFIKSGRSANGKGHYWAIHPANMEDFRKGDFRRRKAQRKVRKHMGLAVDDAGSETPSPPATPTFELIGGGTTTTTTTTTVGGAATADVVAAAARAAALRNGHYQLLTHPAVGVAGRMALLAPHHSFQHQLQQQQHQHQQLQQRSAFVAAQQLHTHAFSYLVQQQQQQHSIYLQQQQQQHRTTAQQKQQQQQQQQHLIAEKQQHFFAGPAAMMTATQQQEQQQLHYNNTGGNGIQQQLNNNIQTFAFISAESTTTTTTNTKLKPVGCGTGGKMSSIDVAIGDSYSRQTTTTPTKLLSTAGHMVGGEAATTALETRVYAQLSQTGKRRQFDVASLLAPDVLLHSGGDVAENPAQQKYSADADQRWVATAARAADEAKLLIVDVECVGADGDEAYANVDNDGGGGGGGDMVYCGVAAESACLPEDSVEPPIAAIAQHHKNFMPKSGTRPAEQEQSFARYECEQRAGSDADVAEPDDDGDVDVVAVTTTHSNGCGNSMQHINKSSVHHANIGNSNNVSDDSYIDGDNGESDAAIESEKNERFGEDNGVGDESIFTAAKHKWQPRRHSDNSSDENDYHNNSLKLKQNTYKKNNSNHQGDGGNSKDLMLIAATKAIVTDIGESGESGENGTIVEIDDMLNDNNDDDDDDDVDVQNYVIVASQQQKGVVHREDEGTAENKSGLQQQQQLQVDTDSISNAAMKICGGNNNNNNSMHCDNNNKSEQPRTTTCLDAQHILAGYYGTYMNAAAARRRCISGNYFALLHQQQQQQQTNHHHQQIAETQQQQSQHYYYGQQSAQQHQQQQQQQPQQQQ